LQQTKLSPNRRKYLNESRENAERIYAYMEETQRDSRRILLIRRKNEEYAGRNFFPFQQCLGTLKGQYFKKLNGGLWPRMNSYLENLLLSAYV